MPLESLPCEYLFTLTAGTTSVPPVTIADGPQGSRLIVTVSGGSFEGPRLRGKVAEVAAGDWLTMRADGSFRLDVRLVLETDDGASILMSYNGVGTRTDDGATVRSAPTFETGDERYTWLNGVQAVGLGATGGPGIIYDVYAIT